MLRETRRVHAAPHLFDVMRIFVPQVPLEHIYDHLRDQMRVERNAVRLPDSLDVAVGNQLDEHEIASAVVWGRVPNYERFDVGEFHFSTDSNTAGKPGARRSVCSASSRSFTTWVDQAPPPYCARARLKICSVSPSSSRGTPSSRP